jgi:beta-glucosidase
MPFPDDFIWGAATAAAQIEGAADTDGKGRSIWDVYCDEPGKVWQNHTCATACDHYNRWQEDIALMRGIGLGAYRFSVSWPRVMPGGTGTVNAAGLDFYDRLVDALLEAGIAPWCTLFHWDLPHELHCRGGWLNPDSPRWFADYTAVVAERLAGRVAGWMTFNEPQCFVGLGYERGEHAPGFRLPFHELLRMGHHILLAHGRSVQALRAANPAAKVGFAPHAVVFMPARDNPADIAAARSRMFAFNKKTCWSNTWWADPMFLGHYPDDMLALCEGEMPPFTNDDMALIAQPLDYFGVNLYAGTYVMADAEGNPRDLPWSPNVPLNAFKFVVTPEAMHWGTRFYHERYKKPVLITENGVSCTDWPSRDGLIHDAQRIDYTARYLVELERAIDAGAEVAGYFHWSLMDNFEWSEGYKERLGLVYVNLDSLERTPKESAHWYRRVIETNGASLHEA